MKDQKSVRRRWLSPKEAARYLGCHISFLDRDRHDGHSGIPYSRLGSHIRYDLADLDNFLRASRIKPAPKKGGA